jgi:hypothetical protein
MMLWRNPYQGNWSNLVQIVLLNHNLSSKTLKILQAKANLHWDQKQKSLHLLPFIWPCQKCSYSLCICYENTQQPCTKPKHTTKRILASMASILNYGNNLQAFVVHI